MNAGCPDGCGHRWGWGRARVPPKGAYGQIVRDPGGGAGHPVLAGDGPRAGHLGHAQKRTCGKSPKTWPEPDPHRVSEVLKADHPDANRPGQVRPAPSEECGNRDR